MIGIGGSLAAPPLPTTVRTGPYTAVREVALTRFDQGRETERFEVGIGESHGESFAPGEMPGATTAAGHVAQFPQDSQRDECRSATPWSFPLAPKSGPQSQSDPASESDQFLGRFAEAKIAAPPRIYVANSSIVVLMLTPLALRVISRVRCLNRSSDFGAIVRLMSGPTVKLKPRNFRSCGRATALFVSFTLSLSFCVMKREMLSITR